ncbi:MAG: acyltransferase [Gemmatimonadaceae bacterium]|nr:acyltransferase [Gemmatimonadaceae bacterium]
MKTIPSLDGIRALSVLIVFVSHAGLGKVVPGGLGVTIFFFLSGFLITSLLRLEYARTSDVNVKAFYIRRFLRLGPPLILTLLIAYGLVIAGVHPGGATASGFLAQLFYFANYFALFFDPTHMKVPYGTGVLWSLSVEEHFYLLFPIVFLLLARRVSARVMMHVFIVTCGVVLAWRLYLAAQPGIGADRIFFATDTRLDSILFGAIFALGFDVARMQAPARSMSARDTAWLVCAGLTLVATLVIRNAYFRDTLRYTLQGVALMPIFYCAIVYADSPIFRPLNWAWLRRIGVYSYSIYLIHYVVVTSVQRNGPFGGNRLLIFLASLGISLLFAAAVERYLESRLRVMRRRFH